MQSANPAMRIVDSARASLGRPTTCRRRPGRLSVALRSVALLAVLGTIAGPAAWAKPQEVQQTSIKGEFVNLPGPPPKRVWRETITYRNDSGHALPGAIITSQPYSGDKAYDTKPGSGKTAKKLEQKVDFAADEEKKVVFDHPALADGKAYFSWYTDVYDTQEHRDKGIGPWVGAGAYSLLEIPPDRGGSVLTDAFSYPYPDAINRRGLGAVTFSLVVTELDLPPGWTFVGLSDDSFLLDPENSHLISATFNAPTSLMPGEVAQVEFDVRIGDETLGNTYLGIRVVPEPGTAALIAIGLGGLASFRALRPAIRRRRATRSGKSRPARA